MPDTQVKIEDTGPARKRLTITIPAERVTEKIEESMSALATQTSMPGFRKGRAPKALLERRFGSTVRAETKNQLIADAYSTAIDEHEIKPVGEPEPPEDVENIEVESGKPLTFSLEVEVAPEFELPPLDGLEIKKPMLEITDELVQQEVDRQRERFGKTDSVDGALQPGDRLVGHGTVTIADSDEPFFEHDGVLVLYPREQDDGKGQVLGLLVDGLDKLLEGRAIGETVTIKITGPEAHEREEIRGQPLTIDFAIGQAVRVDPASVEEIVAKYEFDSIDILHEQIKLALDHRLREEQAGAMRDQICDHLVNAVNFDLPEKLTATQAQRLVAQQEAELLYRGLSQEEVEHQLAEFRNESMELARRRLKLFFLVHRLSQDYQVQVSEQEINGRIAMLAAQREMRPEQLRNELAQAGRLGVIAGQIRDHKTLDRVADEAKITEISAEDWRELQAAQKSGDAPPKTTKKKTTTTKKTSTASASSKKTTRKKKT